MKESYDISVLFKIFKMFLKSGPDFNLRRKMMIKWVKMAEPESAIYTLLIIASLYSNHNYGKGFFSTLTHTPLSLMVFGLSVLILG